MPGTSAMPASRAARSRAGVSPGLKLKGTPSARASATSASLSTVPSATTASGTSLRIAAAAAAPAGVRSVTSSTRIPPRTSARASGTASPGWPIVSTGMTVHPDTRVSRSFMVRGRLRWCRG